MMAGVFLMSFLSRPTHCSLQSSSGTKGKMCIINRFILHNHIHGSISKWVWLIFNEHIERTFRIVYRRFHWSFGRDGWRWMGDETRLAAEAPGSVTTFTTLYEQGLACPWLLVVDIHKWKQCHPLPPPPPPHPPPYSSTLTPLSFLFSPFSSWTTFS